MGQLACSVSQPGKQMIRLACASILALLTLGANTLQAQQAPAGGAAPTIPARPNNRPTQPPLLALPPPRQLSLMTHRIITAVDGRLEAPFCTVKPLGKVITHSLEFRHRVG
jgi:hypothetical protein